MKALLALLMIVIGAAAQAQPKVHTALNSPNDVRCVDAYSRIFARPTAQIRVVFGYKDTRPGRFVGDRHERLAFVQRILAPCKKGSQSCGFKRDDENADLFLKSVKGPSGRRIKIKLLVANSSTGSDDQGNRENPFQDWQSGYAHKAFYMGLKNAPVVFYNGHSRMGGGPDFYPPMLNKAGAVDAVAYRRERMGFQELMDKIEERSDSGKPQDRLRVLGLFSCASVQHFNDEIASKAEAALISSEALLYYADALENSLGALSALLEMRCERDFKKLIRHQNKAAGSQLQNLY